MIYLFFVLLFILLGLFFSRSVYLSSITAVKVVVTDATYIDFTVVPLKPNKKFFKNVAAGSPSSFVSLGNGYFAYYVDECTEPILTFNDFEFCSNVYILKRNRFGRIVSIDMSDRCLNEVLKKFKGV